MSFFEAAETYITNSFMCLDVATALMLCKIKDVKGTAWIANSLFYVNKQFRVFTSTKHENVDPSGSAV